jgi:hypothetical protein
MISCNRSNPSAAPSEPENTQTSERPSRNTSISIRIPVQVIPIPHRIRLQKPPQRRRVHPRLVIVQPQPRHVVLPRVQEVRERLRPRGLPEKTLRHAVHRRARSVRQRHDAALMVRVQIQLRVGTRVLHQRRIHSREQYFIDPAASYSAARCSPSYSRFVSTPLYVSRTSLPSGS